MPLPLLTGASGRVYSPSEAPWRLVLAFGRRLGRDLPPGAPRPLTPLAGACGLGPGPGRSGLAERAGPAYSSPSSPLGVFSRLRPSVTALRQAVKRTVCPTARGSAASHRDQGSSGPRRRRRLPAPLQALAAKNRPPLGGTERHLRHLATTGAARRVHLPGAFAAEAGEGAVVHISNVECLPPEPAAGWAARRLVGETPAGVKRLLTGREDELRAALTADQ